jgi:ABC-type nitrate/sulfonate/bicarbonate transport system substrate-binding protein
MKTIKIAGVPEHFNLPWHLCIENKEFENNQIDLQWIDVPEGTGKMCEMLRNQETDISIILTEGILKDIIAGNESSIIQVYVKSPLNWGIHVDAKSHYYQMSDLKNKKPAISRLGSGSHLMSIVNAKKQGWNTNKLEFDIVNTINGAVESLNSGKSDYFMWEQFMTKPLVDKGIFRKIGTCPTPWPCFVIVVRNEFLKKNKPSIETILNIINKKTFHFKQIFEIDKQLAKRYNINPNDIQEWLSITNWSQENLDEQTFNKIQNQLFDLKIIDKLSTFATIVKSI